MKKTIKCLAYTIFVALVAYAVYLAFDRFVRNPKEEDYDGFDDLEDTSYEFDDENGCECCFTQFSDKVKAAANRQINKLNR